MVKVGGGEGIQYGPLCEDLAALRAEGHALVLVHGGSAETNRVATLLGSPPRFVTSPSGYVSRYTDRAALEAFLMVYCGKINKQLVERLQALGVNALGLSGLDGRLLVGRRKETVRSVEGGKVKVLRGDHTGTLSAVNTELLELLLRGGYLPVLTPPALSEQGVAINVDGDRIAAAVAAALRAEHLLLLTGAPGLLAAFPDPTNLIPHLDAAQVLSGLNAAEGRMKKKVLGAAEAVAGGVKRVVLASANVPNPIRSALAGQGTVID